MSVLAIRDLKMVIHSDGENLPILGGVDLAIAAGEIHGLAGESGSGKTMTGMCVMGIQPKNSTVSGQIDMDGQDLLGVSPKTLRSLRGQEMGMVFQDPSTSLHPQLKVEAQLTDHVRHHLRLSRKAANARAAELLERVGIENPGNAL
ncbi:MAG: ATP-binding cassette domain-containing protein, partial [Propionibacteriaceae bacterium]|nr:ATP-binding cassette domain-containing protein [Propionibacteriaceae bacterium]